jgi:hypothetical protein
MMITRAGSLPSYKCKEGVVYSYDKFDWICNLIRTKRKCIPLNEVDNYRSPTNTHNVGANKGVSNLLTIKAMTGKSRSS